MSGFLSPSEPSKQWAKVPENDPSGDSRDSRHTPRVLFRSGPLRGSVFTLEGDRLSLGRDSQNDVSIPDAIVSSFHAAVLREEREGMEGTPPVFWLEDRGSKNGTYLNRERIQRARLEDGDRFSLCREGPEIQFISREAGEDSIFESTKTSLAGTGGRAEAR